MKERIVILLPVAVIILAIITFNLLDYDIFQQYFFCKPYWTKKIVDIQSNIASWEVLAKDKIIEIDKKKLTAKLDKEQFINMLTMGKMDASKELLESIDNLEEQSFMKLHGELNEINEAINSLNNSLEESKKKLAECQGSSAR